MNLFVFGIGYSAGRFLRRHASRFGRVSGTVRTPDKAEALARDGVEAFPFDGTGAADARIADALADADALLVSVQPSGGRDPVLAAYGRVLADAARLRHLVYLSTIGVYGDHGGAWIDEATRPAPESARGKTRVEVEDGWLALGGRAGRSTAVLRLSGIYGPGRNVLEDLRDGTARRIDKPDQVFNRIHVDDIGGAILAALAHPAPQGVWNVTDDEPAPAPEVVAFGAALLGLEPPPVVPFARADLSPMARSFYGANRRVSNRAMKDRLGVALLYPTYREGLRALAADLRGGGAAPAG